MIGYDACMKKTSNYRCLFLCGSFAVLFAGLSMAQAPVQPVTQAAQPVAQTATSQMPRFVQKDGRWAFMVDGAPYLMLNDQVNNSSGWPAMLPKVWPAIDRLHANTVEIPVYWEQLEPVQGKFDFSVVDALLAGARQHKVHLVLLWFGTWKNGKMHYAPEWVKRDPVKYPRLITATRAPDDTMSPFGAATLEADKTAFVALMKHLKATDPHHTVLMLQVENEINAYGSRRDYSPEATKLFEGQVPADFAAAMHVKQGTWTEAFGLEAENTFQTWSIARYIEQIAKAGKAAYGLPLYLNHSLENPLATPRPGRLEWSAMTDHVLDIWKATAPSLDTVAPDIYMPQYAQYEKIVKTYARKDNALFIPESGNSAPYARYPFMALGYGAIGWSMFGIDLTGYANAPLGTAQIDDKLIDGFALDYELLGSMSQRDRAAELRG